MIERAAAYAKASAAGEGPDVQRGWLTTFGVEVNAHRKFVVVDLHPSPAAEALA